MDIIRVKKGAQYFFDLKPSDLKYDVKFWFRLKKFCQLILEDEEKENGDIKLAEEIFLNDGD